MKRKAIILILILLCAVVAQGQVVIGGHVYGGGNNGNVKGSTSVTVMEGDIHKVFGGARMANVGGNAYVHINGKDATGYTVIDYVYGGNDISGTIGTAKAVSETTPAEVAGNKDGVDDTWNTYVHISTKTEEATEGKTSAETSFVREVVGAQKIYIGQLFGGGNGDFTYTDENDIPLTDSDGNYLVKEGDSVVARSKQQLSLPELDKTYVDIQGGSIVYAYGGGNNATVREKTVIHLDNPSKVVNHVLVNKTTRVEYDPSTGVPSDYEELLTTERFRERMGINTGFSKPSSDEFQIGRLFGGNNRSDMAIRPTWNLQRGKVRNLYSGGNKGRMTSPEGLLLELNPQVPEGASYADRQTIQHRLVVDNVFGGCRMSDVVPLNGKDTITALNLPNYNFPNGLSARVLVRGGDVNNVYGGNDVTGKVYGGSAVGVYTSIRGDVYGGGNGAYPYSDRDEMINDDIYGDFHYSTSGFLSPIDALNAFRPNAEQVSIRLRGADADHPTIIRGSVYCGGNCATLATEKKNPMVELKIGSHVIADKVFLGNNGTMMKDSRILSPYADKSFSSLDLTVPSEFSQYMEGVAMTLQPQVVFDAVANGDPDDYEDNSSYIGSFFCGGNVGSMAVPQKNIYRINRRVNIFQKFVGGCNNANVEKKDGLNAAYEGGVMGSSDERLSYTDGEGKIKDRLQIDLENLTLVPLRWNADSTGLEWNKNKWDDKEKRFIPVKQNADDKDIRLLGGNVYGGCYESGHVNGNVVVNINEDVIKKDDLFGGTAGPVGTGTSGVDFEGQRDDLMAIALTVFGAGYGEGTEIWGSTTVNLNNGYAFQVFGGGEQGVVGRKVNVLDEHGEIISQQYEYNPAYSSTVNLNGVPTVDSNDAQVENLAESEYLYGGGNMGDVCGNTYLNLGNGRIYDAFGGASDADILGHTEVIIGRQPNGSGGYKDGFPWVRDVVYGGNDFGGTIHGGYEDGYDFTARIRDYATDAASLHGAPTNSNPGVLQSSTYVEYLMGRVDTVFGGGYGSYDYKDVELYGTGCKMPEQESSFVNIRPLHNSTNQINGIFGGGTGYYGNRDGDKAQNRSYVLIDIPKYGGKAPENYKGMKIFGSGSYNGLGLGVDKDKLANGTVALDKASAIIDLLRGSISSVYGGSFNEGVTRRTVVNVPAVSTISVGDIFGGAYGTQILPPCDVYESHVNYHNTSENARVTGAIYGGNNNERRTLYTEVNISSPVWADKDKGYLAKVYGAGRGIDTWAEYTEVNLEEGAKVYEVYGGGEMGHVLNAESVQKYMQLYKDRPSAQIEAQDPYWKDHIDALSSSDDNTRKKAKERWDKDWANAWTLGDYFSPAVDSNNDGEVDSYDYTKYTTNAATNLSNSRLVRTEEMDQRDYTGYTDEEKAKRYGKYNANVIINKGATVTNYAYGGGYGTTATHLSGDVYGTTYITLLGGTVGKDIYAAGTAGAVTDLFGAKAYNAGNTDGFTASANVYIMGGTCRNVYGGGWQGAVGTHKDNDITVDPKDDIPGETHVVIGNLTGKTFYDGVPAIQRNVYGGGEGAAIWGTAHVTLNNGYIGYVYNGSGSDNAETTDFDEHYEKKLEDDTKPTPNSLLIDAGCLFGGGYINNSSVDKTKVNIYGGNIRNSAFGGGEIAAIGRGTMAKDGSRYVLGRIYRPGKTLIEMFGGHVYRNLYGGGRGFDNLGGHGSLNKDGYVFGQTEVHIHGGEIGTAAGVDDGDGNVFGGSDIGRVYSAYENKNGTFGLGVKAGKRYNEGLSAGDKDYDYQGYYFKHKWYDDSSTDDNIDSDGFFTEAIGGGEKKKRIFTEDCKVLIEPSLKVVAPVIINGNSYSVGQYVTIDDLNTMKNKNTEDANAWSCLDTRGIIIHNAVFAGGNTETGQSTSANTVSVYGNATASVHDIFHRDMITLGTRHTGGLYGDGNLTLVDGYRELNITNYGTDYYSIPQEITIDTYHALPDREADYYELKYTCLKDCQDKDGTRYKAEVKEDGVVKSKASTITGDELQNLFVITDGSGNKTSVTDGGKAILIFDETTREWIPNPDAGYWKESGVLPVYAGRLMNSIQRADFCGVFGSRMVMQGARDRVVDEANFTNYTINRVREVSLNKKESTAGDGVMHGNYFGIYNIVNYLGALTSDVDFDSVRKTDNTDAVYRQQADGKDYETATYADWKKEFIKDRKRNNGSSHNKVALASGVYLEITTEQSKGPDLFEKDWGPITGVVELDLINVSPGIGGGFVYAKNVHGERGNSGHKSITLTKLNKTAVTKWDYSYSEDDSNQKEWETSGNFVHSTQTIIDDCYNISNRYKGEGKMPAHYWYIKGSVYVYDQYISAYTGTPNAYSEKVEIPLTLTAASHGRIKLLNVMPNLYAYNASEGVELESGKRIVINDKSYYKNDSISYWDWYMLSDAEKKLFVEKTYTNCITCKIDGTEYKAGTYIMDQTKFNTFKNSSHTYTDENGEAIKDADGNNVGADYIFRLSNNVSHDTGYILTYEVTNPSKWDNWYTPKSGDPGGKDYNVSDKENYEDGPTYRLKAAEGGEVLGQSTYEVGDLISKTVEDTYQAITAKLEATTTQATFEKAYIITRDNVTITETIDGQSVTHHLHKGAAISESMKTTHSISDCDEAYICTKTIPLGTDDYIYKDSKMTKTEAEKYIADASGNLKAELEASLVPAYYCTKKGLYGGNYYQAGHNYRALEAWSSMSAADREKFQFNYDALDLLIDPTYSRENGSIRNGLAEGMKYQYDSAQETEAAAIANKAGYSLEQPIDYTASYNSDTDLDLGAGNKIKVKRGTSEISTATIQKGDTLSNTVFEALPNEQRHYSRIPVTAAGDYYVVNTAFQMGSTPYAVGETISSETYSALPGSEKTNVTKLTFDEADLTVVDGEQPTYYYCREDYTQGTTEVTPITEDKIPGANGGIVEGEGKVLKGTVIAGTDYKSLPNQQKNFTIHGVTPTETSTLYVSRNSDIYDLSRGKIITVIYQYDYDETDSQGNVTPVSERHVLNIHLSFKSGVPIVEDIDAPDIILPGDLVSLREPNVTTGAYEITGHGWELFETQRDAESHSNGVNYDPNVDPLYWYQHQWYVAYYAKSYLGRTYSNFVPVKVANYHDMAAVMSDANKAHHMYIDNAGVKREPKIYINDYSSSGKNGLDLFKQLYDLSLLETPAASGDLEGHALLNPRVKGGNKLEFFMRTDIDHSMPNPDYDPEDPKSPERIPNPSWKPIASGDSLCFSGTLHGDGHTISGLSKSLFGNLCGSVYNLGVTGSFTGAGIADKGDGYVESCWVNTTGTPDGSVRAVFGGPTATGHKQLVNCYYQTDKPYSTADPDSVGLATAMPDRAFYNGTVAYDLNNFYLYKRYSDKKESSGVGYRYFTIGDDNSLTLQPTKYYGNNAALCSSGYNNIKYVEDRFADGDFRYAAGTIPAEEDERHWVETIGTGDQTEKVDHFSPIWPDDYIFFGQKLTYGYSVTDAHQEVPTAVVRDGGRLSLNDDANRVYRAPAYFRSKTMDVAHFNPKAYLAQKEKLTAEQIEDGVPPHEAYPNMTAIDFAGHNDAFENKSYELGMNAQGRFYAPLLDDDGLTGIFNCDETKNLLVYAPAETAVSGYANKKTYDELTSYFTEPAYSSYYDNTDYRCVAQAPITSIHGHLVQSDLTATNDHLLVDKQDFNAPLAYSFDQDHLMWYQRLPADKEYVDMEKGWQGISIPFTAELVTTHNKGEITHFYSGSENSKNGTGTKIGHEYWLRAFNGVKEETIDISGTPTTVARGSFLYPAASGDTKTVTNHFLWDYYYEKSDRRDKNSDIYQEYYRYDRSFTSYPLLSSGTPYIIGFPGETYYEFDLSGSFEAQNTAAHITKLGKQIITLASGKGIDIGVSDGEMAGVTKTESGKKSYEVTFKPSYMNEELESGNYVMNADGNAYEKLTASKKLSAFRPYFTATVTGAGSRRMAPERIVFDGDNGEEFEESPETVLDGSIEIFVRGRSIVARSHRKEAATIRIVNVAGIVLNDFVLEPGQTVETPVRIPGVYMANKKKLFVK